VRTYLKKKKKAITKKRTGGVAQGVDPEFKPQYHKTKPKPKNGFEFICQHTWSWHFPLWKVIY
jgi:hypothetical protein